MKGTNPSADTINEAVTMNSNIVNDEKEASPQDMPAQADKIEHEKSFTEQTKTKEFLEDKTKEDSSKHSGDGF